MSRTLAGSGLQSETTQEDGGYGYNRVQWKRFPQRDSAYLSEWASRMGQARANANTNNQHQQSIGRYVPPHARDSGSSRDEAYRSIGEEEVGAYSPAYQGPLRAGSVPRWEGRRAGEYTNGTGSEERNTSPQLGVQSNDVSTPAMMSPAIVGTLTPGAAAPHQPHPHPATEAGSPSSTTWAPYSANRLTWRNHAIAIIDPATHCPISVPRPAPLISSSSVAAPPQPTPRPPPIIANSPPPRPSPASIPSPAPPTSPTLATLVDPHHPPAVAPPTQLNSGQVLRSSAVPSSARAAPLQPALRPLTVEILPQPTPRPRPTTATSSQPRPSPVSLLVPPSPTVTVSPHPRPTLAAPVNDLPSSAVHPRPTLTSNPPSPATPTSRAPQPHSRPALVPSQTIASAVPQSRPRPEVRADPLSPPNVATPPPSARPLLVLRPPPAVAATHRPLRRPAAPENPRSPPAAPAASQRPPRPVASADPRQMTGLVSHAPSRPSRLRDVVAPAPRPVRLPNPVPLPAVAVPPQPDSGSPNNASSGPIPAATAAARPTHTAARDPAPRAGSTPTGMFRSLFYIFTGIGRPGRGETESPARTPSPVHSPSPPPSPVHSPSPPPSPVHSPPPPPPPMHDAERRRRLLEEVDSLMELSTNPDIEQDEHERKQLVAIARETLLRSISAQPPEDEEVRDTVQSNENSQTEGECVVCYDEMADAVLVPCGHLAVCSGCCDAMGIKERGSVGWQTGRCPICRTEVEYRIKIFKS